MMVIVTLIGILLGVASYFIILVFSSYYKQIDNDGEPVAVAVAVAEAKSKAVAVSKNKIEANVNAYTNAKDSTTGVSEGDTRNKSIKNEIRKYYNINWKPVFTNGIHNGTLYEWSRIMVVVIVTTVLTVLAYGKFHISIAFYKTFILNIILVIISFVDIINQKIPNIAILLLLFIGCLFILLGNINFVDAIFGMLFGGGIMWLFSLIPGAIGGGDVKLMFSLGLFLGFTGTVNAMVIAFILASIVSFVLLLFKKLGRKDVIPFGPFLALGTIVIVYFINK